MRTSAARRASSGVIPAFSFSEPASSSLKSSSSRVLEKIARRREKNARSASLIGRAPFARQRSAQSRWKAAPSSLAFRRDGGDRDRELSKTLRRGSCFQYGPPDSV